MSVNLLECIVILLLGLSLVAVSFAVTKLTDQQETMDINQKYFETELEDLRVRLDALDLIIQKLERK